MSATLPPSSRPVSASADDRSVALVTLGCARNEVDSEELAARLAGDGWRVTTDGENADVVLVNTCGFVDAAKQESVETLLAASDTGAKVVAAGCMAERYGKRLAKDLPEADAVLGFDHYPEISARLDAILAGERIESHTPRDRRTLLPISPVERQSTTVALPGHGATAGAGDAGAAHPPDEGARGASSSGEGDTPLPAHLKVLRRRLDSGPAASLKLASGCDRRCAFCIIPSYRGSFVSRPPDQLLAEAEWLAAQGVREVVLVSENSTSYGKDLGDPRMLEKLLPQLAAVAGIARVRVSYLQPAEMRPTLVEAIAGTSGVAPYFDLSFQHSSEPVLRRMRRFGSTERFLELLEAIRAHQPLAGARSNVIVGFPGETRADVAELERFLVAARLDAIGVFGYSDEEGTEAATLSGKVRKDTIKRRYERISALADELVSERAAQRIGEVVEVLVESIDGDMIEGRAAHQAPEVDGSITLRLGKGADQASGGLGPVCSDVKPGDMVKARVLATFGADLEAEHYNGPAA